MLEVVQLPAMSFNQDQNLGLGLTFTTKKKKREREGRGMVVLSAPVMSAKLFDNDFFPTVFKKQSKLYQEQFVPLSNTNTVTAMFMKYIGCTT